MMRSRRHGTPDRRIAPYAFSSIEATATRAVYQSPTEIPHIEFKFITSLGETVTIDMPAIQATEMINQAINAHSVIFPKLRNIQGPIAG